MILSGQTKNPVSLSNLGMMTLGIQIVWLLVLAIPVACVAWTVTHEEVLREPREYCIEKSQECPSFWSRKFFYLFTCEYCLSHYVAAIFLIITRFRLLYEGWRGYLIALFALVWVANQYMSIYNHLRLDIKRERIELKAVEKEVKDVKETPEVGSSRPRPIKETAA